MDLGKFLLKNYPERTSHLRTVEENAIEVIAEQDIQLGEKSLKIQELEERNKLLEKALNKIFAVDTSQEFKDDVRGLSEEAYYHQHLNWAQEIAEEALKTFKSHTSGGGEWNTYS